ncbi:MAG: GNAT family N-acetyltransferase [Paludibacteraceae bacterium]|nr:GNAT family N-acetyltransferase [Paludibacteraceae bacterium]
MGNLENGEIRLRALEPEDLELLYEWENNDLFWADGNSIAPYSRFVLRQYIEQQSLDIYALKQLRLMIELKDEQRAIGTIDLFDFDPHHSRAGVGILVDTKYQSKGYASQALALLCIYAFRLLNLHQLYCHVNEGNVASIRLFQKAGFVECGCLKSWNRKGNEWQNCFMFQKIDDKNLSE